MTNLRNTFYEDKEIQDIMKKHYQIKRILDFVISICLNYVDKTDFLPPNYARAKKCYIENVTAGVNYTNFYTRVYTTV